MPTNQLLPFGAAGGANVLAPADYAALAARLSGFVAGTAQSAQVNSVLRQAAFAAAMLGQFTADLSGQSVLDDGNVAAFLANFERAYRSQRLNYLVAGGTANALTITPNPDFGSLADLVGVPLRIVTQILNTGPANLQVGNLAAVAIMKRGAAALAPVEGGNLYGVIDVAYDGTVFVLRTPITGLVRTKLFSQGLAGTYTGGAGGNGFLASVTAWHRITGWAGGGSGGSGLSGAAGGGGGGGGCGEEEQFLVAGTRYPYIVGGGGASVGSGNPGLAGGSTSFNGSVLALGGTGGGGAASNGSFGLGGSAGAGVASGANSRNYDGGPGYQGAPGQVLGTGGQGAKGGGAGGAPSTQTGNNGSAPAGGSSGGSNVGASGSAAAGRIEVEWVE